MDRIILFYILSFSFSFATSQPKSTLEDCSKQEECIAILNCYKDKIDINTFTKQVYFQKVYQCMLNKAETSKIGQDLFIAFLNTEYNELIRQNGNPSEIAEIWYNPLPMAFSKLRGKEAFEISLKFASQTKCTDTGDVVGGGNLGLNVIEYIVNPMIKSVGGYPDLSGYLSLDNHKNRSIKPTSSDPCERAHEVGYGELIKAYKEGKIVLKKYGED